MVVCEEDEGGGGVSTTTTFATNAEASSSVTTTTATSVDGLPSPWEEYFDSKSGNYYYYNPESGVTQWDRPDGADVGEFRLVDDVAVNVVVVA
jgi:hypothetical protein